MLPLLQREQKRSARHADKVEDWQHNAEYTRLLNNLNVCLSIFVLVLRTIRSDVLAIQKARAEVK